MRSARRNPRTGVRRDNGVRLIRSSDVRYPGTELPDTGELTPEVESARAMSRRLGPARDTGLAVEGRIARQRRQRAGAKRRNLTVALVIIAAISVAALGWRYSSDRRAAANPFAASEKAAVAAGGHARSNSTFASENPADPDPTPNFAELGALKLRLPVEVKDLGEIGFHQASYTYAMHMTTTMPDAPLSSAKNKRGTGRDIASQPTGANALLVGKVVRMWRSRPGKPDSAVDVGAPPGSNVLAPVSGQVIKIKSYKLYGKYDDYEIHIRPDGRDDIDCVMIHVTDLSTTVGSRVKAGVTRVATVRKLSNVIHDQLGDYATGSGDHVHVQFNNALDPRYKGLEGALAADGS